MGEWITVNEYARKTGRPVRSVYKSIERGTVQSRKPVEGEHGRFMVLYEKEADCIPVEKNDSTGSVPECTDCVSGSVPECIENVSTSNDNVSDNVSVCTGNVPDSVSQCIGSVSDSVPVHTEECTDSVPDDVPEDTHGDPLSEQLQWLRNQVDKLTAANSDLIAQNAKLTEQNATLTDAVRNLTQTVNASNALHAGTMAQLRESTQANEQTEQRTVNAVEAETAPEQSAFTDLQMETPTPGTAFSVASPEATEADETEAPAPMAVKVPTGDAETATVRPAATEKLTLAQRLRVLITGRM